MQKYNISKGEQLFNNLGGTNQGVSFTNTYDSFIRMCDTLFNSFFWTKHRMDCDETKEARVVMRNVIVSRKQVSNILAKDFVSCNITFHKEIKSQFYYYKWSITVKSNMSKTGYFVNTFYVTPKINNYEYLSFNDDGIEQFLQFAENAYNACMEKHKRNTAEFTQKRLYDVNGADFEYDIDNINFYDENGVKVENHNYYKDVQNHNSDIVSENKERAILMKERFDNNKNQIPTKEEIAFMKQYLNAKPFYETENPEVKLDMASRTEAWKEEIEHEVKVKPVEKVIEEIKKTETKETVEKTKEINENSIASEEIKLNEDEKLIHEIFDFVIDEDNSEFKEIIEEFLNDEGYTNLTFENLKKLDFDELKEKYNDYIEL